MSESSPEDRVPGTPPENIPAHRKADFMAVLKADQKMSFALQGRDEVGNTVPLDPALYVIVLAVEDSTVVTLTDNGNGSGVVTAAALGATDLTADVTRNSDGQQFHGIAAVEVVAGDIEAISIEFSAPEETTPDT